MEKSYFAIRTPQGSMILNILESAEAWCWAVLYARQYPKKPLPPSQIPPDFINGLKSIGYDVIEMSVVKGNCECAMKK